jgi:hypothetical protein
MEDLNIIEIVVKAKANSNDANVLASYVATLLYLEGFDVVVSSSDEINGSFSIKEKLQSIKENSIVSVSIEQLSVE